MREPPAPWAWSPVAKRLAIIIALAGLLVIFITGLALGGDPSGASTGTAADVTAVTSGSPTIGELASDLGHIQCTA